MTLEECSFSIGSLRSNYFDIGMISIRSTNNHSIGHKFSKRSWFEISHHNNRSFHIFMSNKLLESWSNFSNFTPNIDFFTVKFFRLRMFPALDNFSNSDINLCKILNSSFFIFLFDFSFSVSFIVSFFICFLILFLLFVFSFVLIFIFLLFLLFLTLPLLLRTFLFSLLFFCTFFITFSNTLDILHRHTTCVSMGGLRDLTSSVCLQSTDQVV